MMSSANVGHYQVPGQSLAAQRRQIHVQTDEPRLVRRMIELAAESDRCGCRRITAILRDKGVRINHKRIERLRRRDGLKVIQRQPKRRRLWLNDGSCTRIPPACRDHVCGHDFVRDRTGDARAFRMPTVIDQYRRECLAIDVGRRLSREDILKRLAWPMATRVVPDRIRFGNGSEFTTIAVRE